MDKTGPGRSAVKRWLLVLLKIAVTAVCIWYVSTKIDFARVAAALKNTNWLYLLLATIAFIVSKLIAAYRLNIYFSNIHINLSGKENVKLYWLGMFYNLFLPGAIGGDAYKVIVLAKRTGAAYKKTTSAVLLDRLSGLLGLIILLAVYGTFVLKNKLYILLLLCGAALSVFVLFILVRKWFKDFLQSFFPTFFLGLFVQVAQVCCAYLIMASLSIPVTSHEYIFIFLVSSIVSILPITIGGLGAREIVFLQGSAYFGLHQETSVLISLLFYLITLITSSFGAIYVFRDPLKNKDSLLSP